MSSFALQVAKFAELVKDRADLVVRKVALDALTGIVQMSPVDTGRFRGNWQVGVGSSPKGTLNRLDKSGSEAISAGAATIAHVQFGQVVRITNNLPYARRLEYGWSQQAPAGMVRVTAARLEGIVKNAITAAKGSS